MTWLSEFEEFNNRNKLGMHADAEINRMARVIRELVKGTKLLQEAVVKEMVDDTVGAVAGCFLNNLSPDAKEVIDDCTAPRST